MYEDLNIYILAKLADLGDSEAQCNLGLKYFNGEDVNQDLELSFKYMKLSAEQGNYFAQFNLGIMYENGYGTDTNLEQSIYWYQQSAEQGYKSAQYNLGLAYQFGDGVDIDLEKAIYWYTKAAEQGLDEAQSNLAIMYYQGDGVIEDKEKAIYWFTKAAKQGHAQSQWNLGILYDNGDGVEQDKSQALYWYTKAAENGDANAQFKLGAMYDQDDGVEVDKEKAIYWFTKAAEQGHAQSQWNLGILYDNGDGVEEDKEKALYWYTLAANQGCELAQSNLAIMYYNGNGVEQDKEKAIYWFTKAAEQGHAQSQWNLGILYDNGDGVEQDKSQALYWYTKAAEHGDANAQFKLGTMYYNGDGVEQDKEKAIYWYTKAAEQGDANTKFILGVLYYYGDGVKVDKEKAIYWYTKAAEQGHVESQWNIGKMYEDGDGVKQDKEKAIYWYTKAAEQGHVESQWNIGAMYDQGDGVEEDKEKAIYWYTLAANQGCELAQSNLGIMYEDGDGVKQDKEKALYWFTKAAEQGYAEAQWNLGLMYITGNGIEEDKEKAFYWFNKSAEQGLAVAQSKLGEFYNFGYVVKKDIKQAVYWYTKAAEQGDSLGQYHLSTMYEKGDGVEKDLNKALYWCKKSAKQGDPYGQYFYAFILIIDYFSNENLEIAINLLKKSSEQNLSGADLLLGLLYEEECYGVKDYKLAYYYYKKAAELGEDCAEDIERVKDLLASSFLHLNTRKDIFISWNHNNKDVKDELVSYLEDKGLCTVWDSDGSGVGNINEIIESAINNSKAYILLLTGNSIKSDWVKQEIGMIFNQIKDHSEVKNCIIPIILNYQIVDGKRVPFDTIKGISELERDNPIRNVLDLTSQFAINGVDVDYNSLEKVAKLAIEYRLKIEYRSKIRNKFSTFNAALTKVVDSSNVSSNIISSTLDFNNCYINRPVYDTNDNPISNMDVLKYPLSLIYGEGGTGKTLYLKNIVRNEFKDNNYIFYLPCKNMINDLENELDFIEILKKESFDYYYKNDYKISLESFSNLFVKDNRIIILIDALDEISAPLKNNLFKAIKKFVHTYEEATSLSVIFTSRNSIDAEDISSKLNTSIKLFNLRGLSDEDINTIFNNISEKFINNKKISKSRDNRILEIDNRISKDQFFISLRHISDEIKKNPLLLSNLIYVYIVTHKMPDKQFEIIQKSCELLTNTLDNDHDIRFKYGNYIKGSRLENLLGYLTFKRSKNNNDSVVEIFEKYLEKNNLIVNNDDPLEVAEEIYKYLSRRSIIVRDNVSHEIFRDYYTAIYIYNNYFVDDEDEDLGESFIRYKDGYELKFDKMISNNLSIEELPWPSIATDLLTKLDFEIFNKDTKQVMNKNNLNYEIFNEFLTKTLKEKGYSEEAIRVIEGLANNELLYFTDFIKRYIN